MDIMHYVLYQTIQYNTICDTFTSYYLFVCVSVCLYVYQEKWCIGNTMQYLSQMNQIPNKYLVHVYIGLQIG